MDHPKKQGELVETIKYQIYVIIYGPFNNRFKVK